MNEVGNSINEIDEPDNPQGSLFTVDVLSRVWPGSCCLPLYRGRSSDLPIFIFFPTWTELWQLASNFRDGHMTGILTGGQYRDEYHPGIFITGFMEARLHPQATGRISFINRKWAGSGNREAFPPDLESKCVGWFKISWGTGIYLTENNLSWQRRFFPDDLNAALLLDVQKNEFTLYYQDSNVLKPTRNVQVFSRSPLHLRRDLNSFIDLLKTSIFSPACEDPPPVFNGLPDRESFMDRFEGLLFIDALRKEVNRNDEDQPQTFQDSISADEGKDCPLSGGETGTRDNPDLISPAVDARALIDPDQPEPQTTVNIYDSDSQAIEPAVKNMAHGQVAAASQPPGVQQQRPGLPNLHRSLDIQIADELRFEQAYEQVRRQLSVKLGELLYRAERARQYTSKY